MIVDKKTDKLASCSCGHKPDHYSIAYGRTPYGVQCKCGKRTNRYRGIGGSPENIILFWNEIAPLKELANLTYEIGGKHYHHKDKLEIRRLILDEHIEETYIAFENGRIKMTKGEIMSEFLWRGIDY